ncbi:hypothetical protein F050043D4_47530 [Bacteroides thetaiotaomicron]|uniref:DUF3876 domain-containing protein n=1 Tax=Bacteroides thetaiotaomicron TaxID=818 RepID=UPI0034AC92C2
MLKRFSNQQLEKLLFHSVSINSILTEVLLLQQDKKPLFEVEDENIEAELDLDFFAPGMSFRDWSELGNKTQSVEINLNDSECNQREKDLHRLCGRWISGNIRCGVEISRVGEHFILTYLKRNGSPTDERYVLMWLDGDILYYGHQERITVLALNTQSDILMLSPGVDYTRVPKDEIK